MPHLTESHKKLLAELYEQTRRNRDDLPYTKEFDQLYAEFTGRTGLPLTQHEVWKALANLGKARRLIRKER